MNAGIIHEFTGRSMTALLGAIIGSLSACLYARWKRYKQRQSILKGDARETVVVEHHLVESRVGPDGMTVPATLRMRSLGQDQLERVVPNGHLAAELLRRAWKVTPHHTLISMEGAEGSYLLETLTNFVCDRVGNASPEHDLYVMAPCCEPVGLATHQPITIILIAVRDLLLFENWETCRGVRVEHGSDGARVLTLTELARRFRAEQRRIAALRAAGRRTTFMESCYILDLALDKRCAALPVKKVPWDRFAVALRQMHLLEQDSQLSPGTEGTDRTAGLLSHAPRPDRREGRAGHAEAITHER